MEQKALILSTKTTLPESTDGYKDILSYYGIPEFMDKVSATEKKLLFDNLIFLGGFANELGRAMNSKDYIVEIPTHFKDLLKTGEAFFDKSKVSPGNFTANIRVKGQPGIAGQAVLKDGTNTQQIRESLSNLATMAMMQTIMSKLEVLSEGIEDIKTGQRNDRIGLIVSGFSYLRDMYPTIKTKTELVNVINRAYADMNVGLVQFHFQIEERYKKLMKAPKNNIGALKQFYKYFYSSPIDNYKKEYKEMVLDLQLYYRFKILQTFIMQLKGSVDVEHQFREINNYFSDRLTPEFEQRVNYLNNGNCEDLKLLKKYKNDLSSLCHIYAKGELMIESKSLDSLIG